MFIFHSGLQVLLCIFQKVVVAARPADSGDGSVTVTTTIVPDDFVPADPIKTVAEITDVRDANHTSGATN
jgi:hypothetical protein